MAKRKHKLRKRTLRSAATLLVLLLTAAALRVGAGTAGLAVQQESVGAVPESSEAIGVIVPPPGETEFPVLSAAGSYTGQAAVDINRGIPDFTAEERELGRARAKEGYESYAALDGLGRCGSAFAVLTKETMPTEPRGSIGMVRPSGWHTVRYDDLIDGKFLYNRCHLIAYMLSGENANPNNLITGTRYLNVEGMLPYEKQVGDFIQNGGGAVLYRATPVFSGDELVARGVELEAESLEKGGIRFHVFLYNVQPGIGIDYATGESWRED